MKPYIEYKGKNVKDAVKKACLKLNKNTTELKYDIISNGSTGIWGLLVFKKAVIRVDLSKFNGRDPDDDEAGFIDDKERDVFSKKDALISSTDSIMSESLLSLAEESLQKIVDLITDGTLITHETTNKGTIFKLSGNNPNILIGKHGQNLDAIQYIVEKIVNKKSDKRVHIEVDVEGYLAERRKKMKTLAVRLAKKVRQTGKPSTINQISPHDRRTIHVFLRDDRKVRTQSSGDGYYRNLVILPSRPKKKHSKKAVNS